MDHHQVAVALRAIVGIVAAPVVASIVCAVFYLLHHRVIWGVFAVLLGLSAKAVARGYFSFRSRLSRLGYLGSEARLAVIVGMPLVQYLTLNLAVLVLRLINVRAGATSDRTKWMFHYARNCW